jgi:hypothetical protein
MDKPWFGPADAPAEQGLPRRILGKARSRAGAAARRVLAQAEPGRSYVPVESWQTPLVLEQPPNSSNAPRWGHGGPPHPLLHERVAASDAEYARHLGMILEYGEELAQIPRDNESPSEPCWNNPMFIGLDGAALYGFVRNRAPKTYLEVGSGFSTRFAARARRDGQLVTRIVSIDPEPRAEIDALCDEVVRSRLEDIDLTVFDSLEPGDILFFDGSHRVFMNNDVTVFWFDVVPRVPPGVLIGVHDVWLPEDYPPGHAEKYWSEHYLLGTALLYGSTLRPVLACHHVCVTPPLTETLRSNFVKIGLDGVNAYGSAFWFEKTGG